MTTDTDCSHYWIANSGQGGKPDFKPNRQMSAEPLMHVKCSLCSARTWFTEKQWNSIPATNPPGRSGAIGGTRDA